MRLGNLLISGWKTLISTQSCRKAPGGGDGGVDQGRFEGRRERFSDIYVTDTVSLRERWITTYGTNSI